MKLIETKRVYQDEKYNVDIERYKGREDITVWDTDRSIVATFDSVGQAHSFIQSLTAALVADMNSNLVADVSVDNVITK